MKYRNSFIGSFIAFLLATSCCWLPWLAVIFGGAAGFASINDSLEGYSGVFMFLGVILLLYGAYQLFYRKSKSLLILLESLITCPQCHFQKMEQMPTDACQFFYQCEECNEVIKPKEGDCCVYCSYGTVPCPPIQKNEDCCK
jgi:hypothetical protein